MIYSFEINTANIHPGIMFCRGSCTLEAYTPSIQYRCPLKVISSCPDYFLDWRISDKCENGRIEYVRDSKTSRIYRNWACASCNTVLETPKLSLDIYSSPPLKFYESPNRVELQMKDYGIDVCCTTQGGCASLSTFGYVTDPVTGRCLPIPFVTECNEEPSFPQPETISEVQLEQSLVNRCWFNSNQVGNNANSNGNGYPWWNRNGNNGNGDNGDGNGNTDLVFGSAGNVAIASLFPPAVTKIPKSTVTRTKWIAIGDNSTYLLCGNGSIRNPLTGTDYKILQLHQGEIKVRKAYSYGSLW